MLDQADNELAGGGFRLQLNRVTRYGGDHGGYLPKQPTTEGVDDQQRRLQQ